MGGLLDESSFFGSLFVVNKLEFWFNFSILI